MKLLIDNYLLCCRHEKMISGMYMGELTRLVLEKLTKEGLLFGGKGSDALFTRGSFYTKYVSEIESDRPGTYSSCIEILEELGEDHNTFWKLYSILSNKDILYLTMQKLIYEMILNIQCF